MIPLCVMTPSVQSFVAHTDNFSTTLLEDWKCEIHHSVYIHFKALIVDQGPKADIAIAVNCYIGKQQGHMKFRHSFEPRAVDGVVMASLSNRKDPCSCYFFIGTVSGSVCTDGYAERKQNETRWNSQHGRHGVERSQVVTRRNTLAQALKEIRNVTSIVLKWRRLPAIKYLGRDRRIQGKIARKKYQSINQSIKTNHAH